MAKQLNLYLERVYVMYTCFIMEINHPVIPDFFVNLKLNFVFVKLGEEL